MPCGCVRRPRNGLPFLLPLLVALSATQPVLGQEGYDFEYFVSQVGISTTLKNAWGSQLYQQEMCDAFLSYKPADLQGEISGGLYVDGVTNTSDAVHLYEDRLGRPFAGYKVDYDFNSQQYASQRSLVITDTMVTIGGPDASVANSIGSFTFTGGVQASAPGDVNGGFYFFWIWTTLCNADNARVSISIPSFSVKVDVVATTTPGTYTLTPTCNVPIDASDIVFTGCSGRILSWIEPGIIAGHVLPALNNFICPTLQNFVVTDIQSWLAPNQVVNIDGSLLSVQYTTTSLSFVNAESVTIQASMDFLVAQPDGSSIAFAAHRSTPLPSAWPVEPGHNATTSAVSVSKEAIANFIAAANAGGYLDFNGTFNLYETNLYVNGSIENTSVVFPHGGIHAHMEVHEVFMFLHIHCDAYSGFRIFDVALSHVTEIGEVSCDSWESGISMAFKDLNIHNASMEGLSTSLELPPELLKPLVVKGVNYALPTINEALSNLAFTFPDKVKWLAPLAPNPVTWTVGSSATEEGHITVIWSCECGSTVNETMQCAGSFCPQSSGTLQSAEALPLNDGSCNSPSSEVAFDPQNDDLTTSPAQLCLSMMQFPSPDCSPVLTGENLTTAHICLPADENVTCVNFTGVPAFGALFGQFATLYVDSANATVLEVGGMCVPGASQGQCAPCVSHTHLQLRQCYSGVMVTPTFLNGTIDCGTIMNAEYTNSTLTMVTQIVSAAQTTSTTALQRTVLGATSNNTLPRPTVSDVFVLPVNSANTTPNSRLVRAAADSSNCVPCAADEVAHIMNSNGLYCRVVATTPLYAHGDYFCTDPSCLQSSCLRPDFTAYFSMQYSVPLQPSNGTSNGTFVDELVFNVASPKMAASCVVPQATLFGLPLWVVVIVFGACAAFLLLAASIVHAHIVARRRRKNGEEHANNTDDDARCVQFHGPALVATCVSYIVGFALVLYSWTYTNPAKRISDEFVRKLAYAQSNATNSSFGINFSLVDGQMDLFISAGQQVILVLFAVSFFIVAGSATDWQKFRLARVLGLCLLTLLPLMGFGTFMGFSNWLSVVYMGDSPSGATDSQSTIAAVMSAVWLEGVVVSSTRALANSLMAVPVAATGTLLIVDDMEFIGWSLSGAQWTAWIPSLVTVQMVCALLTLLVKLVLLVTGFENSGTTMFQTFALLASVPLVALAVLGFARCCRSNSLCRTNRGLSICGTFVVRLLGLSVIFGGAYILTFELSDASLILEDLDAVFWNMICVVVTMVLTACVTTELLILSNSAQRNAAQLNTSNRRKRLRTARSTTSKSLHDVAAASFDSSVSVAKSTDVESVSEAIQLQWTLVGPPVLTSEGEVKPAAERTSRPRGIWKPIAAFFAALGTCVIELVMWLAEEGPYKSKDKILFRRGSAVIAAIPLFVVASETYSAVCEPYGFGSIFSLTADELFNCSYDQLTQQLSNYSNATVNLDRSPDSAFYSIIQLRARDMLSGAEFGMLGVTLFFIMALLSILEGIEVPLLRLRKFVFSRWLRREPKPVAAATMIKLERASRVLLVLSRLVGIGSVAVLCVATFTPYTLSYSELLHITCDCHGKFCDMVDQTVTAMFQNLQLSSLAQEIFILSISIPWTLGRIAYFVHLDVAAHAAYQRKHASVPAEATVTSLPDMSTMNNVVWVTFGCTSLFMFFTGTLIGVLGAVAGEPNAVWIVSLFVLGGVSPLFIILFDFASCAAASKPTKLATTCAAVLAIVGVPAAVFVCFSYSGNPGLWDFISFGTVIAYGLALLLNAIVPQVCAEQCICERKTERIIAQKLFPQPANEAFNMTTNFFAVLSIFGASSYCVIMKLASSSPLWCTVIVVCFGSIVTTVGVMLFSHSCCRLPSSIQSATMPLRPTDVASPEDIAAVERWIGVQLRVAKICHTEAISIKLIVPNEGDADDSAATNARITESNDVPRIRPLRAKVSVTKHSPCLFRVTQAAQPVRAFFAQKTLFLYMSWGDVWFLFSILYILAKVSLHASTTFATEYLSVRADQPTFSLLQSILESLFTAEEWPSTLAEFFGADVVLTDIIFGTMVLARLCKGKGREVDAVRSSSADDESVTPAYAGEWDAQRTQLYQEKLKLITQIRQLEQRMDDIGDTDLQTPLLNS